MKVRLLSVIITTIIMLSSTALEAQSKRVLPRDVLIEREFTPDYTKPGGVVLGPAMPRAFHYGGRHAVRDTTGILHVTWEDPTYEFNYYAHSIDTLGYSWTEPIDPLDAVGKTVDRTLMAKMALDPVTNYIYMMPFYRENPGERYKTGITRSMDGGANWSAYMDLGAKIGRATEEVSWGTLAIGSDQILHIVYSKDNQDMMYTRADLADITDLADLVFTKADGVTAGDEAISYVPSGVVFQGTIVLDRNGDPHVIFSGDGGSDTFGDKTPYHIYYKTSVSGWGPIPPQQLMAELESSWGMPEMVFDANNRGYYFLDKNNPFGTATFGTWEPPVSASDAVDFGTLNGTGLLRGFEAAVDMIQANYSGVEVTDDDDLYLPQADVDDANDIVYLVASTANIQNYPGGDIYLFALHNARTYAGVGPADMPWVLERKITDDGDGLGDIGADMIYNPASSKIDIFWSGAGPATNEANYFPAHVPQATVDAQALGVSIGIPGLKEQVNEGDVITINGVIKNNGKNVLLPPVVTLRIIDLAANDTLYTSVGDAPPLSAGQATTPPIEFGTWAVVGAGKDLSLTLTVSTPGDEAPFNDQVGTSFFVYPALDAGPYDTFEDITYTNFPTVTAAGAFLNDGDWYPAVTYAGGWTVVDSSHGQFATDDPRNDYISTWILQITDDDVKALVRHLQGVRGDTLFGDIELGSLSDSLYAQPQDERLFSPYYTIDGDASAYSLKWDDDIDGTDGTFNFPISALVDFTIDGGATWDSIYHRVDTEGEATDIAGPPTFLEYDLTTALTGADSVRFRFWWKNPKNDGKFALWEIDNVYFVGGGERILLGTETRVAALPGSYALRQNYPNPFNPVSTISYSLPTRSHVTIKVFDLRGREVMTLVNGEVLPGNHTVGFNGRNLASGVYFYTLQADDFVATKKMLLLK